MARILRSERCRGVIGRSAPVAGRVGCGRVTGGDPRAEPYGPNLRAERPAIDVGHGLEADRLVDVVRGRVCQVREEEAELPAPVERRRAGFGDEVAGIAATSEV